MKNYILTFGSGDPRSSSGLSPTFVLFYDLLSGSTITPPGITEIYAGSGMYRFQFGTSQSVGFLADGGSGLSDTNRYIPGNLDPIQAVDEKVGYTDSSFGTTASDPSTVLGYLRRSLEFNEGDAVFAKSSGTWSIYSRGSSTMLRQKSLTNNTTEATKE